MKKLASIAGNALKEAVRDKILYNLVFFGVGLILFSLVLGEWSLFSSLKVIQDFTLGTMSVMNLLLAIFIGIGILQREIQKKTLYSLLTKPIPRWYLLVGKYLGLVAILGINLILMSLVFLVLLGMNGGFLTGSLLLAIYFIFLEMSVILALAFLFASFSTPILSALFTLGIYVGGHLTGDLHAHLEAVGKYGDKVPGAFHLPPFFNHLIEFFYWVVPNLEHFNIKGPAVHGLAIPADQAFWVTGYALLYICVFLGIASYWFTRRDFN